MDIAQIGLTTIFTLAGAYAGLNVGYFLTWGSKARGKKTNIPAIVIPTLIGALVAGSAGYGIGKGIEYVFGSDEKAPQNTSVQHLTL